MEKITVSIDNESYYIIVLDSVEFSKIDSDEDKVNKVYGDKSVVVKIEKINGQTSSIFSSDLIEEERTKLRDEIDKILNP